MLPDEVLKEIEKGPHEFKTGPIYVTEEAHKFATRIAELATRLEREACVKVMRDKEIALRKVFDDFVKKTDGTQQAVDYSVFWKVAAEAIEARGK